MLIVQSWHDCVASAYRGANIGIMQIIVIIVTRAVFSIM